MKVFRILKVNIRDAFKSVGRNFSLSLASIACSTITLIIVAVALVMSFNVNNATRELESDLTIDVFLEQDLTEEQVATLKSQIIALDNIEEENVVFISNDEWKADLENESEDIGAILETLETNPLRDSFEIKVEDVNLLKKTSTDIEMLDNVFAAKYGEGKAESFIKAFDVIETVTIIIVGALVIVTVFLISNTIKLTIFSRRSEIEIMRLVGTPNLIIRLPFLFEGLILGIIGSIIPVVTTVYGYFILYEELNGFVYSNIIPLINPTYFIFYIALTLLALGGIVGMFGSYRAVRKYLKI